MGILSSNKELSASTVDCGGSFKIALSLSASPNIISNPTDIVLILDRSGSMAGSPLANMKAGARKFIDIIDEATDGVSDGQIGYGSRIGVVSFSSTASQDTQLITSVAELKKAVDSLTAGGSTNHEDAFTKALEMFDPNSSNAKVMVMFTDGRTTAGGSSVPVTTLAKSQGVTIYCIGLSGNGGINEEDMKTWVSQPYSAYLSITPDDEELENLFEELAKNIIKPGATDIEINDTVNPCFKITSISTPTRGTAFVTSPTSLKWKISELGVIATEAAKLEFTVQHVGSCLGTVEVNESITYSDNENNEVVFPSPEIEVNCGTVITPEECPAPVNITIDGCEDTVEFDAGDVNLESLGRILKLDVTLNNVCPGKRVALALILTEDDEKGKECPRGMKTLTIPAHNKNGCRDVTVRCIKFVLPKDINTSGCYCSIGEQCPPTVQNSLCRKRHLKVRIIANYIDTNFTCCTVDI